MKKLSTLSILFFVISFTSIAFGGKIVYPWRSTTAIVKAGETFEVWMNADANQTVNEVSLRGPYNNATATIVDTKTETWVYDKWSENTCNRKITISVPANTPADRYDLILKTSTGDEISLAAVKVIKEFKTNFYVMHFSDAHRWQGTYDTPNIILREISTIIDIANIIDPEMLMETGDNHYQNTNSESSTLDRINQYMNGFMNGTVYVNGLNNAFAPVFNIPGNHDTPLKAYELEAGYPNPGYEKIPSQFFNKFYGLQAHNFTYGSVRFIGVNNAWFPDDGSGTPNFSHQTDEAISWLNTVGKGTMRIGYCHVNTGQPLNAFNNPLKAVGAPLDLIIFGHCHSITYSPFTVDGKKMGYSTLTPRDGTKKVPFNLYKIDAVTGTYEAVGNEQAAQEGIEIAKDYNTAKLKLIYANPNDGTNGTNTATIINKFNFPITNARVRFVAPKGSQYYLRNATISQEFDGTNVHVIDAVYNLEANSTTVVTLNQGIQVDLCPNDPNKMDPGLCGCGVPEGSCPIAATAISLNATAARLVLNTTRQLKATISPANTTNKIVNWVSSNPAVATINSDGEINAISVGNTTISASTYDASKLATASITVLPTTNIYQAEDAEYVGPLEVTNQPGYNGTGFLDYTNASNDYIKWNVYVPTEGTYTLTFRYSLASNNRPLKLTINDEARVASVSFPITGAWSTWSTYTVNQALVEGANSIMLTAIGSSGGNFDELTIGGNGISSVNNIKANDNGKTVRISPNPLNSNKLSIDMIGFENSNNVQVKIFNLLGQTVYQKNTFNPTHLEINTLNLLSKSIYTVSVESGATKVLNKLILN